MEQTVATLGAHGSLEDQVVDSMIKPLIISDVNILSPGIWTGPDGKPTRYTAENIAFAFSNTNWIDMNLFLDHKDAKESAVAFWVGMVRNVRMEGENLTSDLEIWHPFISMFIKQAKAKFAVSATMSGREIPSLEHDGVFDYLIDHFNSVSLVDEPGCQTSWLPRILSSGKIPGDKIIINSIHKKKAKELKDKEKMNKVISLHPKPKKNLEICKEVKKMENETKEETVTEEASTEQASESTTESAEAAKEKSKAAETSSEEDSGNGEIKELSSKFDKLSRDVSALTSLVKKSLSAGEESTEESTEETSEESKEESKEESEGDSDDKKELAMFKKELSETKKELSALNEKLNAPDRKSLASGGGDHVGNIEDSNLGMLGYLRERSNIDHY